MSMDFYDFQGCSILEYDFLNLEFAYFILLRFALKIVTTSVFEKYFLPSPQINYLKHHTKQDID